MTQSSRFRLRLECLESRDVPAVFFNYTDVDGDNVRITNSLPFSAANTAALAAASNIVGGQLQLLNLTPAIFTNTSTSIMVVAPFIPGNNRLVNVGYINSTGHYLGNVTVRGDLGQIDAGDGTIGLNALDVRSLGRLGTDTQAAGGSLQSDILGKLGSLNVAADVKDAFVSVTGGLAGTIGSIIIGGSLIGGSATNSGKISSSGDMGAVRIGRDVQGGLGSSSGLIQSSNGNLASVRIGGSLIGSGDTTTSVSGEIYSGVNMGPVWIGRNIQGGTGGAGNSGFISSSGTLASLFIGGSLIGGLNSGSGAINSVGNMGAVTIGHDVLGGEGFRSGYIHTDGKLASVSIGGSLIGGSNIESGKISSEFDMGKVTIGDDVQGGSGVDSGFIFSNSKLAIVGGVTIGGSLIGGSNTNSGKISSSLDMGAVRIGCNVQGGSGTDSGFINSAGNLASVRIGGSLIGGSGFMNSGTIHSSLDMGAVTVRHDVKGDSGLRSGVIESLGKLASVHIFGSLIGGTNGSVSSAVTSGAIFSNGNMGSVTINRNMVGGPGCGSGNILSLGTLAYVNIGGSLIGGSACHTGTIFSSGDMGAVKIAHDLIGGSLPASANLELCRSGAIESLAGRISSVYIGGSIISGIDANSSFALTENATIRAANDIGSLTVAGSIIGHGDTGNGASPVVISARGRLTPTATTDLAIGSITVGTVADGGRVEFANILAGYNTALTGVNADAQIGAVLVRGDWAASNLVAGASNSGFPSFGDASDAKITGGTDTVGILSRIASITINGQVFGTPASVNFTDHYGFVAEQIGSLTIGTILTALVAGPHNDNLAVGETSDMKLHEV